MKKIISILLAVMLVVSVAAVSVNAYGSDGDYSKLSPGSSYDPSDSYTVDDNTPTCEEAILACGGDLNNVQKIYFQLPLADPKQDGSDWVNQYNTDADGNCQICVYWWGGTAGSASDGWPSGKGCTWVGYRTKLIDKENRIYEATVPADGNTPLIIWNNGVNGGMDETKPIFKFGRQLADANIEGAYEGDYDPYLPEGTPNEDNMDGCIQIIDYTRSTINPLTQIPAYESNWYIYYGDGCYGNYKTDSPNYHGKHSSCVNPEHLANPDKYHPTPGDVNYDKEVDINDVLYIQQYLAGYELKEDEFNKNNADVDGDGYISIIDATRIQRYLAHFCNIDGTKPYTG